jgi:hypothetical protein
MFQIIPSRNSSFGSVVRALRLIIISVRLPVQIQPVCFCPSGVSAPARFKSSEGNPAPSSPSRHGGLPPRDNSFFLQDFKDSTRVRKSSALRNICFRPIKIIISPLHCDTASGKRTTWHIFGYLDIYSGQPGISYAIRQVDLSWDVFLAEKTSRDIPGYLFAKKISLNILRYLMTCLSRYMSVYVRISVFLCRYISVYLWTCPDI